MHMAWVRQVCGRLKSDYRYSNRLVYNNFPWPNTNSQQTRAVEAKAQAVLARAQPHLPPRGMPHSPIFTIRFHAARACPKPMTELDRAVEKCYRPEPFHSDRERVEFLFSLYEKLTAPLLPVTPKTRGRRSPPR